MSIISIEEVGGNGLSRASKLLAGVPGGIEKAVSSALKRAGEKARTESGRYASAEYTISKGTFTSNTKVKIHAGTTTLELSFAGYVLPIVEFNTKFANGGYIQTQRKRGGASETLERAFVTRKYGNNAVMERMGESRYPIEGVYGPSTAQMMKNDEVIENMEKTIRETYEQRIEHEILRVLNGWGG